ncbi:MAG TPA: peptide-methionine (S)-S-oxide reductase MsrA, partial [Candidatus Saccharimonadales bacterium]|nr:peptide-methionine (S)-S-oxide reductase MsrA [Candidatus Saccharimonadales bacterium]
AAGCFWGVQNYFDEVPGVLETEAGYTGGHVDHPTYEQVCAHTTGHAEAVKIIYDPSKVSYRQLLKHFFRMHDPTQLNRQGPDIGDNYRSAIFYMDDSQKAEAEQMIKTLNKSSTTTTRNKFRGDPDFKTPVVTTVEKAGKFWPAEEYHQKYTQKTGIGACHVAYKPL